MRPKTGLQLVRLIESDGGELFCASHNQTSWTYFRESVRRTRCFAPDLTYFLHCYRRETVHLPVARVRPDLLPLGRALASQAHAHGREEVRMRRVRAPLHALGPPHQAHAPPRARPQDCSCAGRSPEGSDAALLHPAERHGGVSGLRADAAISGTGRGRLDGSRRTDCVQTQD